MANIKGWGWYPYNRTLTGCSTNVAGTQLTCATGNFTAADVGRYIGLLGQPQATITTVYGPTSVGLSVAWGREVKKSATDGVTTAGGATLTSATVGFDASDVGNIATSSGKPNATILSRSGNSVTISPVWPIASGITFAVEGGLTNRTVVVYELDPYPETIGDPTYYATLLWTLWPGVQDWELACDTQQFIWSLQIDPAQSHSGDIGLDEYSYSLTQDRVFYDPEMLHGDFLGGGGVANLGAIGVSRYGVSPDNPQEQGQNSPQDFIWHAADVYTILTLLDGVLGYNPYEQNGQRDVQDPGLAGFDTGMILTLYPFRGPITSSDGDRYVVQNWQAPEYGFMLGDSEVTVVWTIINRIGPFQDSEGDSHVVYGREPPEYAFTVGDLTVEVFEI